MSPGKRDVQVDKGIPTADTKYILSNSFWIETNICLIFFRKWSILQ
jgi:hypothetical protein